MNSPDQFKLLDREVIENPYPFYSALLREAPVYRVPGTDVYLISGYQLIHEVLKNQRDYSANLTGILVTGENGQPELFDLPSSEVVSTRSPMPTSPPIQFIASLSCRSSLPAKWPRWKQKFANGRKIV